MSISQNNTATVVCREVFDETSHPSNEGELFLIDSLLFDNKITNICHEIQFIFTIFTILLIAKEKINIKLLIDLF